MKTRQLALVLVIFCLFLFTARSLFILHSHVFSAIFVNNSSSSTTVDPTIFLNYRSDITTTEEELILLESSIDDYYDEITDEEESTSTRAELITTTTTTQKPALLKIPILVFVCNRTTVLDHLEQLLRYRPNNQTFPIVLSFDQCNNKEAAKQAVLQKIDVNIDKIIEQPNSTLITAAKPLVGYYHIARHYKWALDQIFLVFNYSTVIITEDDLNIAADFFEYFTAVYPLLLRDPSIWCISAWNENGRQDLILNDRPDLLHRSDFFPGLGWMMRRDLWTDELRDKWPVAFWDDWMRRPDQRKGRACIRPEISRTTTFGRLGVSKGQFFDKYLRHIHLNTAFTKFTQLDLSYLENKEKYDANFNKEVYDSSTLITYDDMLQSQTAPSKGSTALRINYGDKSQYKTIARHLRLEEDFKSGIMRMAYCGVVIVTKNNYRLYITPEIGRNFTDYNSTWT